MGSEKKRYLDGLVSRREVLAAGTLGALSVGAAGKALGLEGVGRSPDKSGLGTKRRQVAAVHTGGSLAAVQRNPYAPFRMGIQSYSLRGYDFNTAVEKTKQLGLHYWEAFQQHVPQTADMAVLQPVLDKLKACDIQLKVWGVQGFDGDEAKCRAIFEFAKLAGLESISADPTPEALPILDKLTAEFKINIAIHNHGPGARYAKLSDFDKLKPFSDRVGVCIDTGHTLRSGEDPVVWLTSLGKRVHDLHLKDVKDKTKWAILGQGDLRLKALLEELKKMKYSGTMMLEYEENPGDPIPDIDACLAALRSALAG